MCLRAVCFGSELSIECDFGLVFGAHGQKLTLKSTNTGRKQACVGYNNLHAKNVDGLG